MGLHSYYGKSPPFPKYLPLPAADPDPESTSIETSFGSGFDANPASTLIMITKIRPYEGFQILLLSLIIFGVSP